MRQIIIIFASRLLGIFFSLHLFKQKKQKTTTLKSFGNSHERWPLNQLFESLARLVVTWPWSPIACK